MPSDSVSRSTFQNVAELVNAQLVDPSKRVMFSPHGGLLMVQATFNGEPSEIHVFYNQETAALSHRDPATGRTVPGSLRGEDIVRVVVHPRREVTL